MTLLMLVKLCVCAVVLLNIGSLAKRTPPVETPLFLYENNSSLFTFDKRTMNVIRDSEPQHCWGCPSTEGPLILSWLDVFPVHLVTPLLAMCPEWLPMTLLYEIAMGWFISHYALRSLSVLRPLVFQMPPGPHKVYLGVIGLGALHTFLVILGLPLALPVNGLTKYLLLMGFTIQGVPQWITLLVQFSYVASYDQRPIGLILPSIAESYFVSPVEHVQRAFAEFTIMVSVGYSPEQRFKPFMLHMFFAFLAYLDVHPLISTLIHLGWNSGACYYYAASATLGVADLERQLEESFVEDDRAKVVETIQERWQIAKEMGWHQRLHDCYLEACNMQRTTGIPYADIMQDFYTQKFFMQPYEVAAVFSEDNGARIGRAGRYGLTAAKTARSQRYVAEEHKKGRRQWTNTIQRLDIRPYEKRKENDFIKVPNHSTSPRVSKPTASDYTPARFRQWVHGESTFLRNRNATSDNKYMSAFMSGSARICYLGFRGNSSQLAPLLADSTVFWGSMRAQGLAGPTRTQISDFIRSSGSTGLLPLTFRGRYIYDMEQFLEVAGVTPEIIPKVYRRNKKHVSDITAYFALSASYEIAQEAATGLSSRYDQSESLGEIRTSSGPRIAVQEQFDPTAVVKLQSGVEPIPVLTPDSLEEKHPDPNFQNSEQDSEQDTLLSRAGLNIPVAAAFAELLQCLPPNSVSMVNFVMMIISIYDSKTWKGASAAVFTGVQLLGITDSPLTEAIFDELSSIGTPKVTLQGNVGAVLVGCSGFVQALLKMAATAIARAFDTDAGVIGLAVGVAKAVALRMKGSSEKSLAQYLLSFCYDLLERLRLCFEKMSLTPLVEGSRFDPRILLHEMKAYNSYHNMMVNSTPIQIGKLQMLVNRGDFPDNWPLNNTEQDMIDLGTDLIDRCTTLLMGTIVEQSETRNVFSGMKKQVTVIVENYKTSLITGTSRLEPYAIFGTGDAGQGKTVFAGMTMTYLNNRNSWPEENSRYDIQLENNFQDGLRNQLHLVMDDQDKFPSPQAVKGLNHVQMTNLAVNSKPWRVEQADVESKGRVNANPVTFWNITNYTHGNLKGFTAETESFWRRYPLYLKISAKPEFVTDGVLDPNKVAAAEDQFDYLDIDVSVYEGFRGRDQFQTLPYRFHKRMGMRECMKFIGDCIDAHRSRSLDKMKLLSSEPCPVCFLNGCKICPRAKLQSGDSQVELQSGDVVVNMAPPPAAPTDWFRILEQTLKLGCTAYTMYKAISAGANTYKCIELRAARVAKHLHQFGHVYMKKLALATAGAVAIFAGIKLALNVVNRAVHQADREVATEVPPPLRQNEQAKYFKPIAGDETITRATWTMEDLIRDVRKNLLVCRTTGSRVYALRITSDVITVPKHFLRPRGKLISFVELEVSQGKRTYQVGESNVYYSPTDDWGLIKVPLEGPCPQLLRKFWPSRDDSVSAADLLHPYSFKEKDRAPEMVRASIRSEMTGLDDNPLNLRWAFVGKDFVDGDCGLPYVVSTPQGPYLAGFHVALISSTLNPNKNSGVVLSQSDLAKRVQELGSAGVSTGLVQTQMGCAEFTDIRDEKHSEVSNAFYLGKPITLLGHLTSARGATFKSKVKPLPMGSEPEIRQLAIEWTGREDYWQPPNPKGHMVEDKWVSPLTHSFEPLGEFKGDYDLLFLSMCAFLYPFTEIDISGYRVFSERETIAGQPEYLGNAVNLKTSTGYPIGGPKRAHMSVEPTVASEQIWQIYDSFSEHLDVAGVPVGEWTLKDEAVSYKKNDARDIRVFINYPAAFNMRLKRLLGWVKFIFRTHIDLSHSAVGVNMTSDRGSVPFAQILRLAVGVFIDMDFKKMDKSIVGEILQLVFLIFALVARLGGATLSQMREILVAGEQLRGTAHCWKGDFFFLAGMNGSGQDLTVDVNAMANALANGYCILRQRDTTEARKMIAKIRPFLLRDPVAALRAIGPLVDIRNSIAYITYGDDLMARISDEINLEEYTQHMRELNFIVTDGQKNAKLTPCSVAELSFLKRTYREDPDLGVCFPITKKTLAKMLTIAGDAKFTIPDHQAALCTNVARELVLHGRAEFEKITPILRTVASRLNFDCSIHFNIRSFDEYKEKYLEGDFGTWGSDPLEIPELV